MAPAIQELAIYIQEKRCTNYFRMFMRATTLFPSGVSSPGSPLVSIPNVFTTSSKADKRARTWSCLCLLAAVYFTYKFVGFLWTPRAQGWTDDHKAIPGHSLVNGAFTIGEPGDIVGKWKAIRSPVGWSSSGDGINVIGDNCDSWGGLSPRVSRSFIGLQGRNAYIEQSLVLDPLKNYTLTFSAAVRPGHSSLQALEVKAAGERVWIGSPASASLSDSSFQPYTATFAPRVSEVSLRFVNLSPTHIGDNAIFLDDVSIQPARMPARTCAMALQISSAEVLWAELRYAS
ncbi:hypothetical protein CYMTET_15089 [Cymbomonas tetramitiformis]|uniref:Uncharacterized protein n=1 Tax=Cymbomonas tetramitiformis TaxID=36881 RepID=A0AAE0GF76_9CHLO|nr:hypothetical protein CYMTET_15089 [Cymbomonas tetramitiformis]